MLHEKLGLSEYLFTISCSIFVQNCTLTACLDDHVLISQTNRFQVVTGFNDTNNVIFVLYQYQDGMMQWSSSDSEVSIRICETEWRYELPNGDSVLHSSIVSNTNVNEAGRYAFLYKDGVINPAGMSILAN